jgi:tetratricopeptide (TPR) repeat protein
MLAGIATFLVHNLIEFSIFESGSLFLFAMLSGAALGIRLQGRQSIAAQSPSRTTRAFAVGRLGLAAVAWCAWGAVVFLPIAIAEGTAHDADLSARAGQFRQATALMRDAFNHVPYNAEYATRQVKYLLGEPGAMRDPTMLAAARRLMDAAVAADPSSVSDRVARAQLALLPPINDIEAGLKDYRRAVALDPANIRLRVEYATTLKDLAARFRNPAYARESLDEFHRAVIRNDQYHWDEAKRLGPAELAAIRSQIAELESRLAKAPVPQADEKQ